MLTNTSQTVKPAQMTVYYVSHINIFKQFKQSEKTNDTCNITWETSTGDQTRSPIHEKAASALPLSIYMKWKELAQTQITRNTERCHKDFSARAKKGGQLIDIFKK